MTEFTNGHPQYDQLLALMDRDLPRGGHGVRRHVRECGKCHDDMAECHSAVRDYARYEQALVLPAIPPVAKAWLDLRTAMRQLDESRNPPRVEAGVGARLTERLANGASRLIAGGTALGCVAFAIILAGRFENRPTGKVAPPSSPTVVTAPTPPALDSRKAGNGQPRLPVDAAPPAVESPMNTEVRVFAALHRLGADLGEPVEVGMNADGKIVVGGAGLGPARQAEIREALAGEPRVVIRFADPVARRPGVAEEPAKLDTGASSLEARLKAFAGGQAAYESLSNRVLDESDTTLARTHALRTLEHRFPMARRSELYDTERRTLDAMTAAHRAAFEEHARKLLLLLEPAAKALGASPASGVQPGGVLESAQRMDRVLSAIFGAAQTGLTSDELLAELSNASAALSTTLGGRP